MNYQIDNSTLTIYDVPASRSIRDNDGSITFTLEVDYYCQLVFEKMEDENSTCTAYISNESGELVKCFRLMGLSFLYEYGYFFQIGFSFDREQGRFGCFESAAGEAFINILEYTQINDALKSFFKAEYINAYGRVNQALNIVYSMRTEEQILRNCNFVKSMSENIFLHPKTISAFEYQLTYKISELKLPQIDFLQIATVSSNYLERLPFRFDYIISQLAEENIEVIQKRCTKFPDNSEINSIITEFLNGNFENFVTVLWNEFGSGITIATIYWLVYLIILDSAHCAYASEFIAITQNPIEYYKNLTCEEIISEFIDKCYNTIATDPEYYYCICLYFLVSQAKIKDTITDLPDINICNGYKTYYTMFYNSLKEKEKSTSFDNFKSRLNGTQASTISTTIDDIDLMTGKEFENFIANFFAQKGYRTEMTKETGDQGIDVIAEKGNTRIGIQAKCYSGNVGNAAIQEAVAGKAFYKLDKVMVITNSSFTQSAMELAQANDVVLWDRAILKEKL